MPREVSESAAELRAVSASSGPQLDARPRNCPVREAARHLSKALAHEAAGVAKGSSTRLQTGVPEMPSVDHLRPDLQRHGHVGFTGCRSEAYGIIEQSFRRPHLDQHR